MTNEAVNESVFNTNEYARMEFWAILSGNASKKDVKALQETDDIERNISYPYKFKLTCKFNLT